VKDHAAISHAPVEGDSQAFPWLTRTAYPFV
jgi:hypothetical protein